MAGKVSIGIQGSTYYLTASKTTYVLDAGDVAASSSNAIYESSAFHGNTIDLNGVIRATSAGRYGIQTEGTGTTVKIGSGGIIDAANGVHATGNDFNLVNHGMIYGATTGVLLDGGARNRLTNDGSIIGGNSGLYIDAAHARVANHGVIQGDYAVDIHDTDVSFQNDGTIVGTVSTIGADGLRMSLESDGILMSSGRALRVQSIAGETAHIVNEGKISGVDMAFDGGAGNEVLINRGTISGSVTLGTGNDVFDNRHGTLLSTNAYGQGGRDVSGESGNDTYIIDSRIRIIELAGGGEDTVKSTISINFGAGNLTYEELENLTLIGGRDSNGTGSALDNTIKGNGGDNILSGAGGTDLLTGNAGADTFVFKTGFGHDTINDFGRGADRIDLRDFVDVSGFNDFMKHHVTVSGADLIIGSGSDTLTLLHTAKSDLDASDFMF